MEDKIKAIQICKNLNNTIKIVSRSRSVISFSNPMFDAPRARKSNLIRKKEYLMKEYNINESELND